MTTFSPRTIDPATTTPLRNKLGIAGVGGFFAVSVLAAAVTDGYSARRDTISGLAALDKPYAPLMIFGFLLAAAGLIATGVALAKRFGGVLSGRIAAGLVLVSGGLMAVAGLARVDCSEAVATCVDHGDGVGASTSFWIHQFVSLAMFVLLVVAAFVLIRAVRRTEGFGFLTIPARVVAWTGLLVTLAMVVVGFAGNSGLVQRPYLAVLFGWPVLLTAVRAR